jgi:hypothetical protein
MTHKNKLLFICKQRHIYSHTVNTPIASGLYNSAQFVVNMLNHNGVNAKLANVIDANSIDKEVTLYKPTHVVIEALWVTPEKMDVLIKRHPKVKWIVRLHSEIPFLAGEGIAMEWLYKYLDCKEITIGANSERMTKQLSELFNCPIMYLPNYYPTYSHKNEKHHNDHINIGCFGAIRPLKNQLIQAISAIEFGNDINKSIHFHINATRVEGKGEPILRNIESLFANNPKHKLVRHEWMSHHDFVNVIKKMDLGMQVSYSETFNIVTADFVNNNIPIIVSPEIFWVSDWFKADPNSVKSIKSKLKFAYRLGNIWPFKHLNKNKLEEYDIQSKHFWLNKFTQR